jgi:hypothetical protein
MRYNEHQANQEVPKKDKSKKERAELPKPGNYGSEKLKKNDKNSHLWGQ